MEIVRKLNEGKLVYMTAMAPIYVKLYFDGYVYVQCGDAVSRALIINHGFEKIKCFPEQLDPKPQPKANPKANPKGIKNSIPKDDPNSSPDPDSESEESTEPVNPEDG